MHDHLTTKQRDRVAGVLVGQACGDALGVPYEFASPIGNRTPEMIGGGLGPYAPGEWSDDSQMAICVARVTAKGHLDDRALGQIGQAFSAWRTDGASDIGNQTRAVLAAADRQQRPEPGTRHTDAQAEPPEQAVERYRCAAREYTRRNPLSAGNGALMRNGIVGLTALSDRLTTAANARAVAELTHADPLVLDSCVLHAEAVRHAVLTGEYRILAGLDLLPESRRDQWREWLDSAAHTDPAHIEANGSTFGALRVAHAAISGAHDQTSRPASQVDRLRSALENAVRAGHDTDTVAAITGSLAGALYGISAIPGAWRRRIHGWPGMRERDLVTLALRTAGAVHGQEWPVGRHQHVEPGRAAVPLPCDEGVLLGTQSELKETDADAVVSLSRIGVGDRRDSSGRPQDHVEFWIVDSDDPQTHNDLAGALCDAADTVAELRAEGNSVLLHCVHAHHRTPSVAFIYAVAHCGLPPAEAERQICETLGVPRISGLLWTTAHDVCKNLPDASHSARRHARIGQEHNDIQK